MGEDGGESQEERRLRRLAEREALVRLMSDRGFKPIDLDGRRLTEELWRCVPCALVTTNPDTHEQHCLARVR